MRDASLRGVNAWNASGTALAIGTFLISELLFGATPVQALPSFARQTGQPCGQCHTDFPALTPFGRQFKLNGYTLGGGEFRTTPFNFEAAKATPPANSATKKKSAALMDFIDGVAKGQQVPSPMASILAYSRAQAKAMVTKAPPKVETTTDTSQIWVPPIAFMGVVGLTHTQVDQDPTGSPWQPNNNVALAPASVFWGGAITEHIGAFAQGTYVGAGMGAPGPFDHQWGWDNTDIRYADSGKLGDMDITWGITANNNPSVQDLWNTTPAWKFPFATSTLAPTPAASTIIDGAFAAHVVGAGGYVYLNNLVYAEATLYQTLNFNTQNNLGVNPFDAPGLIADGAPYFRVAIEPHWGNNWLEFGAFGMFAKIRPWLNPDVNGDTFNAATDKYTDIGFDTQYQYQAENYWLTLRGSYIHEEQRLDASGPANLGAAANPTNELNTVRAEASLAYGIETKVVFTGQYFNTWGTSDTGLYGGLISGNSPNSNGFVGELAWIPFGMTKAPIWPWFNARFGLQYTYYNEFDGDTVHAQDNNTLFAYAWFAF